MTTFSQSLEPWSGFYILAGTAAATLMGLLFVAISLLPQVMADRGEMGLRAWVGQTMSNLILLLILSLTCLVPDLDPNVFALVLLLAAGQGIARGLWRARYIVGENLAFGRWRFIVLRGILPLTADALLIYVAIDVLGGMPNQLDLLVIAAFLLVSSAAGAAWQLLEEMGERAARKQAAEAVPPAPPRFN